jgi:hypothetical protein
MSIEGLIGILAYVVAGGSLGVVAAWSLRRLVSAGVGLTWRSDGWPHGVQEEEPTAGWGSRLPARPGGLSVTEPETAAASIEELGAGSRLDVPVTAVRR